MNSNLNKKTGSFNQSTSRPTLTPCVYAKKVGTVSR